MSTSIYFIAILPEQEIQDEITAFKQYAAEKFNTKRALTSPPHITLVAPFRLENDDLHKVLETTEKFAKKQTPFDIELKDFNCFAPRVIYLDIMKSAMLDDTYRGLNSILERECDIEWKFQDTEFHPHMTVAFKDLKESMFTKAWKYFRRAKYKNTFNAQALNVLKHDGKEWQIFKTFGFGGE